MTKKPKIGQFYSCTMGDTVDYCMIISFDYLPNTGTRWVKLVSLYSKLGNSIPWWSVSIDRLENIAEQPLRYSDLLWIYNPL